MLIYEPLSLLSYTRHTLFQVGQSLFLWPEASLDRLNHRMIKLGRKPSSKLRRDQSIDSLSKPQLSNDLSVVKYMWTRTYRHPVIFKREKNMNEDFSKSFFLMF